LLGLRTARDLLEVRQLEGWLSRRDARLYYETVIGLDVAGDVAEIGCWKGKSTVLLARAARRAVVPRTVWAIDPHEGAHAPADRPPTWEAFLRVLRAQGVGDVVRPLRLTSVEAAERLRSEGRRLAFLYVDGCHDEDAVAEDLSAYLPLLAPTAWVAMDDARPEGTYPGVYRAFERILAPLAEAPRWGEQGLLVRLRPRVEPGGAHPGGAP
jgi:predicted O-methyltransferase YrrM